MKEKIPMIVIEGPTASGKTAYAVSLAGELGGEIISGDSMQVYRGMDIGTAKPTKAEMNGIPHHLIDVADIGESFSAARFVSLAGKAAADIHSRGRVPVVVGGTGLYVDTLVSGISLAETECDEKLRAGLYDFARENGAQALHERLANVDPASAAAIHPNNIKRVVRALEIFYTAGKTKTELDAESRRAGTRYDVKRILLRPADRERMYSRIDTRVDEMFRAGLEDEVYSLYLRGLAQTPTAGSAIGYKEFYPYFAGECALGQVRGNIKLNTRHYAKRQLTWLSRIGFDEIIEV